MSIQKNNGKHLCLLISRGVKNALKKFPTKESAELYGTKWASEKKFRYFVYVDQNGIDERNKDTPVDAGKKRQWLVCGCGFVQYEDYIPYSTSNPYRQTTCGHDYFKLFRLDI